MITFNWSLNAVAFINRVQEPIFCGVRNSIRRVGHQKVILVIIKQYLQGFMALFPMVGVIASYEARTCLWTVCRQIPVLMLTLLPMIVVIRLLQPAFGIEASLALGWVVFLAILIPLTRWQWRSESTADKILL